jgi:hypothetical protein
MKYKYNRIVVAISSIVVLGLMTIIVESCAISEKITAKSGAQLWAENCQRCHNTPPPNTFSQEQWETIGMHMQTRALLTDKERDKIVAFLKQ